LVGLLIFLMILGLIAGVILLYANVRFRSNRQNVKGLADNQASGPTNVLILGSDTRENLTAEERKSFGTVPGKRADTIILLHLDEGKKKAVMVQFPRDLKLTSPGGRVGKINGVYNQGADAMVQAVKTVTGLPVNHYIEVDFNGFNNIVNTLGGVNVFFEKPLKDQDSGLNVPRGCVRVEGSQALAFVRVRKIDDDFGRISRQQLFVKLMMDKILTPGTLLNPAKVVKLVDVFGSNVKHDSSLSVNDAKNIALRLRGFNSGKVDMRVFPSAAARERGVDYVVANEKQSKALFEAIRNETPLPDYGRTSLSPLQPADVRLSVLNGTSKDKLAQIQAGVLAAKGFQVLGTGEATPAAKTVIYYLEGHMDEAKLVADTFGGVIKPMPSSIRVESEIAIVLGQDSAQGTLAPAPPPPPPPPGAKPSTPPRPLVHACDK